MLRFQKPPELRSTSQNALLQLEEVLERFIGHGGVVLIVRLCDGNNNNARTRETLFYGYGRDICMRLHNTYTQADETAHAQPLLLDTAVPSSIA